MPRTDKRPTIAREIKERPAADASSAPAAPEAKRSSGSFRLSRTLAASVVAAACFSLVPNTANAISLCVRGGGCAYFSWLTWEWCNAHTSDNPEVACFGFATAGSRVLQRANGQATLVVDGKPIPIVIPTAAAGRALQSVMPRKGPKADPAALRKAFDAAYAGGSRKIDDATARALAAQFNAPIEGAK